ncbi:hypothetical protein AT5G15745 [Arabidopsis thaliana]|uniref:Uncharacterized protein n=1 Tax=Arabidopsis thaliana TaxID=3702 RepID=A0A1P8BGG8_ARATH|nr:uncharacterized protein AT5G15745 [Arabidopsis thaliana]ANM70691.1 hypothetical protein AT5G15745 [Arabidopsis thaliana]|eukprot:NP_001332278.1 hypothetical protein AT5G15745 [Arabidopsis thaliana]
MGDESLRGEPVGVDRRRKKKDVGEIGRRFRCGEKKRQECANFRTFFYQGGKKKEAVFRAKVDL